MFLFLIPLDEIKSEASMFFVTLLEQLCEVTVLKHPGTTSGSASVARRGSV